MAISMCIMTTTKEDKMRYKVIEDSKDGHQELEFDNRDYAEQFMQYVIDVIHGRAWLIDYER
jgi:hypothetical protein